MSTRANIQKDFSAAWKGLYALSTVVVESGLSTTLNELIKVRSSQINQCAFCLDMHTKEALKAGITPQKLFMLNAWKESTQFTDEEKAVLAITEAVTKISENGVPDDVYENAQKHFDNGSIAKIVMAIIVINSWNRVAISAGFQA
ncbi:MAG: carboxymuconolactone decarboxylase family protein [Flavitalea sp.]